jgi:four helix bundle protein
MLPGIAITLAMFDFEKLEVYQIAKGVVIDSLKIIFTNTTIDQYIKDQWKKASLDILLNLAEATGRMTTVDKKHYITISRSSVFECVSILQILGETGALSMQEAQGLYDRYEKVSKMLLGMYRSHE